MRISNEGVRDICESIFSIDNPLVVEAYSECDVKPLAFKTSGDLEQYILKKIADPKGLAHLFIVYPEMKGKARLKKIKFNPKQVPEHRYRYTWDGWGMITVQIVGSDFGMSSNIRANSEARAKKWAPTYPEFESPSTWDWKVVTKHKNRLKRVLKKYVKQ